MNSKKTEFNTIEETAFFYTTLSIRGITLVTILTAHQSEIL